jgi:hypothetical protein
MEHVRLGSSGYLLNRVSLCAKSASGLGDTDNRNTGLMKLNGKGRLGHSALQQHYDSDIVPARFLADCKRADYGLESAETSGRDEVKNSQSPASRSRKPFSESPAGILSRGSANDEGDISGIHPPSIRNAPR